jgi:hypothetical protein
MTKQESLGHSRQCINTTAAEIKPTDRSHTLLAVRIIATHLQCRTKVKGIKKHSMCAPVTCKKPHLNMYQTALDAQKQTLNTDIVVKRQKKHRITNLATG